MGIYDGIIAMSKAQAELEASRFQLEIGRTMMQPMADEATARSKEIQQKANIAMMHEVNALAIEACKNDPKHNTLQYWIKYYKNLLDQ